MTTKPVLVVPSLLLLPGLDGTADTNAPFLEALGDRLHSVSLTFSEAPSLSRADLARTVLADWPASRPIVIVGQSFSTAVAVAIAAERPPGLAGVVLVTPSFAASPRWPLRYLAPFLPPLRPPRPALRWLLLGERGRAADLLAGAVERASPRVVRDRLREYLTDPTADDPAGLEVPVLAIRAAHDRLLWARPSPTNPGVEWVTLKAPHLVLAAAPAAAAAVIVEFANRVSQPH